MAVVSITGVWTALAVASAESEGVATAAESGRRSSHTVTVYRLFSGGGPITTYYQRAALSQPLVSAAKTPTGSHVKMHRRSSIGGSRPSLQDSHTRFDSSSLSVLPVFQAVCETTMRFREPPTTTLGLQRTRDPSVTFPLHYPLLFNSTRQRMNWLVRSAPYLWQG